MQAGLRSLFVGFETLNATNLAAQNKRHNLGYDYDAAVRRLHDLGVMINASFVFGMDSDDESVFERTVDWAVQRGIETATFHILTPYPGTPLHRHMAAEGRIATSNWDMYDTRHAVYQPARMTAATLEAGYWRAYRDFYGWGAILQAARTKPAWSDRLRHVAYTGGWKKMEPLWDWIIRHGQVGRCVPLLETVLAGRRRSTVADGADHARQAHERWQPRVT